MRRATAILAAMLALIVGAAQRPASAEKWALMVGVNKYASPRIPELRGCTNDILLMKGLLTRSFGFKEDHIRVLFDQDATKTRILAEIDNWLVKNAKPGDVALLEFSGHGSQIPDDNRDEPDGLDQSLCPYDVRSTAAGEPIASTSAMTSFG